MLDFGMVTTGLGTILGAIVSGLVAWKTMQKDVKVDAAKSELDHDLHYDQEQREWRAELHSEIDKLRARAEKKQTTIEGLLAERFEMKKEMATCAVRIIELEHQLKEALHELANCRKPATPEVTPETGKPSNGQ